MTHSKPFWLALMLGLLVFYAYALVQGLTHGLMQRPVILALLFLAAHTFEIPVAFRALRGKQPNRARVVVATIVFGLAWWIPAKRGLFAVA